MREFGAGPMAAPLLRMTQYKMRDTEIPEFIHRGSRNAHHVRAGPALSARACCRYVLLA